MNKKIKKINKLMLVICILLGAFIIIKFNNYFTINENTDPILLINLNENRFILHYFQKYKGKEEIPINVETDKEYSINKDKAGEILFTTYDQGIVKFNYITGDMEQICSYEQIYDQVLNSYKSITELHFVPDSNDVSFVIYDKVYIWKYDEKRCVEIYNFNYSCYAKLGFAYEWKDNEEIYMIHSGNLVLYNVNTQNETILIEDIGNVYFNMSDDGNYLIYQKQYGESREITLINMYTKKQRKIHVAKSNYKVEIEFSPDGKYIFMLDYHRDNHLGKRYLYLYDMSKERKHHIKIDYPNWGLVGW